MRLKKNNRILPSRREKSVLDYFLINKNLSKKVIDIQVRRGPEIGSDHFLLELQFRSIQTTLC